MWHYSTLRNIEQFFWWKLMLRNHLLILPSSWNNSINVPDKMCYRETTFFRFVSCIADSLSLQKSQLLCWLLWITPPQDICFLPCFLHVGQGKRCDWLWFELFSYWWGITGCSFRQRFLTYLWKYWIVPICSFLWAQVLYFSTSLFHIFLHLEET